MDDSSTGECEFDDDDGNIPINTKHCNDLKSTLKALFEASTFLKFCLLNGNTIYQEHLKKHDTNINLLWTFHNTNSHLLEQVLHLCNMNKHVNYENTMVYITNDLVNINPIETILYASTYKKTGIILNMEYKIQDTLLLLENPILFRKIEYFRKLVHTNDIPIHHFIIVSNNYNNYKIMNYNTNFFLRCVLTFDYSCFIIKDNNKWQIFDAILDECIDVTQKPIETMSYLIYTT